MERAKSTKRKITESDMEKSIKEYIDKALKLVEAGGAMDNEEAKQILRHSVKASTVISIMNQIGKHIDWKAEKSEETEGES